MKKYLHWIHQVIRPFGLEMAVVFICQLLLSAIAVFFVIVSKKAVDFAVAKDRDALMLWCMVFVIVVLVRIALQALQNFLTTKTEIRIKNSLRARIFNNMLHIQTDGSVRRHSADVINRMQEDVRVISNTCAAVLPGIFGAGMKFLAALAFFLVLDYRLALIIAVMLPVGIFSGRYIVRKVRALTLDIRKNDSDVQSHLQESVQHLTLIQSLEYEGESSATLTALQGNLYGSELKRARFSIVSRVLISLAFALAHAVAFIWSVAGIASGTVTYGMMTAFLQLVTQIQRPLMELSSEIPSLIRSVASIDRLMELEDMPKEDDGKQLLYRQTAGIEFSHVDFAFADAPDRLIYKDFSYIFAPGSRTAIVGRTGVGKSTMIRLMMSFLKPVSGKVEIFSDKDGRHEVCAATRCNLVYVPQGNSLFSGTVRENLLMGNPEATDGQLEEVLHTAAADFVYDLKNGIDTECFEAGGGLSEGQAQRIAIARALLRPGSILLLDEFSSALDNETETLLLERLTSTLCRRTMIFITHRDRIIDYCDSVLRLQ